MANKQVVQDLMKYNDIITIQEHWLFKFEENEIIELADSLDSMCLTVCSDEDEPIQPHYRPRGKGGLAIIWKKELHEQIQVLPELNNRIAGIKIGKDTVLFSVYLTSRGGRGADMEFEEQIEQLKEINTKYMEYKIVYIGDFNASLHREKGYRRDKVFKEAVQMMDFILPENYPETPTFYHCNGMDSSQIDYILSKSNDDMRSVEHVQSVANNTSTHIPVKGKIRFCYKHEGKKVIEEKRAKRKKVIWEKVDIQEYERNIKDALTNRNWDPHKPANELLQQLTSSINEVSEKFSVPINNRKGKRKLLSPSAARLSRESKSLHWTYKNFTGTTEEKGKLEKKCKQKKKELRACQRRESAEKRHTGYKEIMNAKQHDLQLFYKLIQKQRGERTNRLSKLFIDDRHLEDKNEIREGWAKYFSDLSTPTPDIGDEEYNKMIRDDVENIETICLESEEGTINLSMENVVMKINGMKNGKSPDSNGISAEHLKFGGQTLAKVLQIIFNKVCEERKIPESFKNGIITPIYKKQNKPIEDPNSYRRITVSDTIGKIFEKIHLDSVRHNIETHQNALQRGFTKGTSPGLAALLLTEAIAEAKDLKKMLYATFLDASKAFDVVWHDSMLHKLYHYGLKGTDWLLMKEWYQNMSSQVKWEGSLSTKFMELQGVRQGGVWSPTAYKMFLNPALEIFQNNSLGMRIGSVNIASPTCADDELLLSMDQCELATMTKVQEDYSKKEHYKLSEQKSKVMVFNQQKKLKATRGNIIELHGKEIEIVEDYKHIGIKRTTNTQGQGHIDEAISIGRKTTYALMGAGLHGYNGINPKIGLQIWNIYIKPRVIYGLENIKLSNGDRKRLNQYHKRWLKQMLQLPERTADEGVYIIAGEIPIEAEIDRKILTRLMQIFRGEDIEKDIAERQLAVKDSTSNSWFIYAGKILEKYDLPKIHDLYEPP
ncbi:hypothetical protein FSP39_002384 [Pinctada imbricata]|uniref:Reverse transcriptase domain-containing protein n=1 Tax=Pinctada imbricata TaxID=66713 RepID=A0AA89BNA9_PINIB|nr:hypothetical protein FSP39_002384 [Pinctada imbricata]